MKKSIVVFIMFLIGAMLMSNYIANSRYSNFGIDVVCQPPECGFYYNSTPRMIIQDSDYNLLYGAIAVYGIGIIAIYKGYKGLMRLRNENKNRPDKINT